MDDLAIPRRTPMNRLLAASVALCAFWATSCAGEPAADTAAPSTKNMPTDLTGEIRRAQELRSEGHFQEAASALSQLMLVAPDDARVVGEYGKVLAQENRAQDALAFLKRAIELQPNDWTLYSAQGVAYDESNNSAEAIRAYQHALSLKPGEPSVLNNYAVSRMLTGDLNGAQVMLAQAQAAGGSDPRIANNAKMVAGLASSKAAAHVPVGASVQAAPAKAPQSVASAPLPPPMNAKPQVIATGATKSVVAAAPPRKQTTAVPIAQNPQVVMQRVPFDPLAGPVKTAVKPLRAPRKLATAAKPAAKTPAPILRTAADTN
jgi:Flp pilus assembly protein TadD